MMVKFRDYTLVYIINLGKFAKQLLVYDTVNIPEKHTYF